MRQFPAVIIILIFVVCLLLDWYILSDIRRYCKKRLRKRLSCAYIASVTLCMALLLCILIFPKRRENVSLTPLMWMIYAFSTIYVPKLLYVIISFIGRIVTKLFKLIHNRGVITGVILSVALFGLMWWGICITRYDIEIERVEIQSPKLPAQFNGYRIVQFSDAHVGTWGSDTVFISRLVDKINSLNPDLIVFTGDIVNRQTSELKPFLKVLARLRAKDGVYSVLGNHDYGDYAVWNSPREREDNNLLLARWEREMGWKLLNNENVILKNGNDSIVLIGVENWGEPPFHQYGDLRKAYLGSEPDSLDRLNDSNFKILLSHNPEHWNREVALISNIDLTLSGHTHAMQMMIGSGDWKWSPASWRYKKWGGLYSVGKMNDEIRYLYVNIGCGEVGIPARFGSAYPEVTEITLKSSESR